MDLSQNENQTAKSQTVVEHLGDLRAVLFRSLIVFALGFFVCFQYAEQILQVLKAPILQALPEDNQRLYYFGLMEQFYTYLKISFIASAFFTSPFLIWQLWIFISPALKANERKLVAPFIFGSTVAFLLGAFCAYRWAIPYLFSFLIKFNQSGDEVPLIRLGEYINLILQLMLASALIFEFPVVLSLLGRLGIITAAFLKHIRLKAYVGLSVFAAILTPTPDAFTMLFVLIPLVILYEISVWMVQILSKDPGQ